MRKPLSYGEQVIENAKEMDTPDRNWYTTRKIMELDEQEDLAPTRESKIVISEERQKIFDWLEANR